jgi:hypothetical protein
MRLRDFPQEIDMAGNGKTGTAKRPVGRPPNKPASKPAAENTKEEDMAVTTEAGFSFKKASLDKIEFAQAATLGDMGSKYDALVNQLKGMKPGEVVLLVPEEGEDPKVLRNRITGPIRKKAQPEAGGKLRIRLTTNPPGQVAIVCEEWAAEETAAEGEASA